MAFLIGDALSVPNVKCLAFGTLDTSTLSRWL